MKNEYKIDINSEYSKDMYPYGIWVRKREGIFKVWKQITYFQKLEEAKEYIRKVTGFPIYPSEF